MRIYADQNTGSANIKGNDNNGKKISSVEAYASYENGGEEVIVIPPPQENTETTSQPEKESSAPLVVSGDSGESDEISARLYERG